MKFGFGRAKFLPGSRYAHPDFVTFHTKGARALSLRPKTVHAFDCALGAANPSGPDYIAVPPVIAILSADAKGRIDKAANAATLRTLLSESGFKSRAAFEKALMDYVPVRTVKVPKDRLLKGIDTRKSKFIAVAWVQYYFLTMTLDSKTQTASFLLGMAEKVRFALIEIGRCKPNTDPDAMVDPGTGPRDEPQDETPGSGAGAGGAQPAKDVWRVNLATVTVDAVPMSSDERLIAAAKDHEKTFRFPSGQSVRKVTRDATKRDVKRRKDYIEKVRKAYGAP